MTTDNHDARVGGPYELSLPHYEFVDQSERLCAEVLDIVEFEERSDLGRDVDVNILVKWTNQTYHDDNLRAMFTPNWDPVAGISRTNSWRHRNRYYEGLIVQANLAADHLDNDTAILVVPASQPSGVDTRKDGLTAFACADKVLLSPDGDPTHIVQSIGHSTFARLHSVEFSPDGQRLLTASSSLDLVHELDLEGNILWTFDAWEDTPFNTNQLEQSFFRDAAKADSEALRNPDPIKLKDDDTLRGAVCVLDDPGSYNNLGLTTNLTPVFINTASYDSNGNILTTSFHRGEAWAIDPNTRRIDVVAKGMRNPHGLHRSPDNQGFMVTDTMGERAIFIDQGFEHEVAVDFSSMGERKPGLERSRWLQYTTRLGEDLYCAVIAPRQRITLFDPVKRIRRDIPFDPEWGIQMITRREQPNTLRVSLGGLAARNTTQGK